MLRVMVPGLAVIALLTVAVFPDRHAPDVLVSVDGYAGADACGDCHADQVRAVRETAHAVDSRATTIASLLGELPAALPTTDPDWEIRVEAREGALVQHWAPVASTDPTVGRAESAAVTIGTKKGQTFLFWSEGELLQLPVSYVTGLDAWTYSPGYVQGVPDFERAVPRDCLVCHTTYASGGDRPEIREEDTLMLGITCERCHGPAAEHVRLRRAGGADVPDGLVRIARLERDQQVEVCGLCHSGTTLGARTTEPFSFRPGDRLSDHFRTVPAVASDRVETHANQLRLLAESACYRATPDLTCSSCHEPHSSDGPDRTESCRGCHTAVVAGEHEADSSRDCVDCHMPDRPSSAVSVNEGGRDVGFAVRSHRIGVYSEPAGDGRR